MTYSQQRVIAIAVAICLAMLGAVALGNAETLGISPRVAAWLTVASIGLGALQSLLPSVRGSDQQPQHIASRIMELTPAQRTELRVEVDRRHTELWRDGVDIEPPPHLQDDQKEAQGRG